MNENEVLVNEEREAEDNLEIRRITKDNAVFFSTPGGFIGMELDGKRYERVQVFRTFPFTAPEVYISVREPDWKAREIGLIENLNDLEKQTRERIEIQLNRRYFTPKIQRILDVKMEYGYAYFDVVTDRGPCKFTIPMSGSVARLSETRLVITDIDQNRFEVADLERLTSQELRKLDLFI